MCSSPPKFFYGVGPGDQSFGLHFSGGLVLIHYGLHLISPHAPFFCSKLCCNKIGANVFNKQKMALKHFSGLLVIV